MFRKTRLAKGNGKYRVIYAPDASTKVKLKALMPTLRQRMIDVCDYAVCHGFMPGRSCVTNASYHIGFDYTLSMDLKSFFDTVTPELVPGLDSVERKLCFPDGAARQGLPTSPLMGNMACAKMDRELLRLGVRYTRYADDLTFSFNETARADGLLSEVPRIVREHGFMVNDAKTHLMSAKAGRRIVTGVAVGRDDVHETRGNKRRRRAAQHQHREWAYRGLRDWMGIPKLRCPLCWQDYFSPSEPLRGLASHIYGRHMGVDRHLFVSSGRLTTVDEVGDKLQALVVKRGHVPDYCQAYEAIWEADIVSRMETA